VGSIPASRTKALKVKGQISGSGLFLLCAQTYGLLCFREQSFSIIPKTKRRLFTSSMALL
jgi:hypothetical protein